jgi:hypothetical protein
MGCNRCARAEGRPSLRSFSATDDTCQADPSSEVGGDPTDNPYGTTDGSPHFGVSLVSSDMDPFDRTFLPAAAEAGLPMASISRQIPIFRRCIGLGQTVLLVTKCSRLDQPFSVDHLMLLTRERIVIASESRFLHRARLHLDADVSELGNVRWEADGRLTSIEFSATAADGVRERFLIKTRRPGTVWHLDAALGYVFRPTGTRRFNSVAAAAPSSWMNPVGAY